MQLNSHIKAQKAIQSEQYFSSDEIHPIMTKGFILSLHDDGIR